MDRDRRVARWDWEARVETGDSLSRAALQGAVRYSTAHCGQPSGHAGAATSCFFLALQVTARRLLFPPARVVEQVGRRNEIRHDHISLIQQAADRRCRLSMKTGSQVSQHRQVLQCEMEFIQSCLLILIGDESRPEWNLTRRLESVDTLRFQPALPMFRQDALRVHLEH